jgi:hypothetical protein
MPYANTRMVNTPPTPPRDRAPRTIRQRHLIAMPHWVARGVWELLRARIALARIGPSDIVRLNALARDQAVRRRGKPPHPEATDRVAFIIAVLGRRVPWRSDCLIQAIAAQRWFAALGIPAVIRIGVDRPDGGGFGAHAWLVHEGRVLTGGEIERYSVLIGEPNDGGGARDAGEAAHRDAG